MRKITQEEIERDKYVALPAEERRQRFRDYLDGKREHWHDQAPPEKKKAGRTKRE